MELFAAEDWPRRTYAISGDARLMKNFFCFARLKMCRNGSLWKGKARASTSRKSEYVTTSKNFCTRLETVLPKPYATMRAPFRTQSTRTTVYKQNTKLIAK